MFNKLLLSFLMVTSIIIPSEVAAKTKNVRLNYLRKTITINNNLADNSFILKLNNASGTSKASSSRKSVVSVKKLKKNQFTVKGKKNGKATITVKLKGKKYKCKVTVKKGSLYHIINSGKKVSMKNLIISGNGKGTISSLSNEEKAIAEKIVQNLRDHPKEESVPYIFSSDDERTNVINAINNTYFSWLEEYAKYYSYMHCNYEEDETTKQPMVYVLNSECAEILAANDTIRKEVIKITSKVNKNMTEGQAFDKMIKAIADRYQYDNDYAILNSTTVVAREGLDEAIRKKMGVCYHYAWLLEKCCAYIGIKSWDVSGSFKGYAHDWSRVLINGKKYYSDPTWFDSGKKGIYQMPFELSSKQFSDRSVESMIDYEYEIS